MGLRQKAVEEAEKVLKERRLATEKERVKLQKLKDERVAIDRKKADAQAEFVKRMDKGGVNLGQEAERLQSFEKRCAVEAAAKDAEIKKQDQEVKRAESREQDAKYELNQRIKELEGIKEHKKEWERETKRQLEEEEERKLEDIAETMYSARQRKDAKISDERAKAAGGNDGEGS
jgi:hypothetical protein